jgi:hypothetical protein
MKIKLTLVAIWICVCGAAVFAQTVVITPKNTVYRRPKPIEEFKKTFTVRRPIARASTPALSQKITATISPESVLELNVKEELGEYQWLEQADYKVLYNGNNLLSISLWMEGTAAYPDSVTKYAVVDLSSGKRVFAADVFQNMNGLAAMIKKTQTAEVKTSIAKMKKDPEIKDVDPSDLFAENKFTSDDVQEFSVDGRGVTFYYDYGFPHALEALQPSGKYRFSWTQLKPFIRRDGLLARFVR